VVRKTATWAWAMFFIGIGTSFFAPRFLFWLIFLPSFFVPLFGNIYITSCSQCGGDTQV
jgi:hypothetical protein